MLGSIESAGDIIVCTPMSLPDHVQVAAAERAVKLNPANHPSAMFMARALAEAPPTRERLAVMVGRRWGSRGVRLSVSFLDSPSAELSARIVSHMNAWNKSANVIFVETRRDGDVRIARGPGGYWSYIGTDILHIAADQPTMNLENFTMNTPDAEFHRVVRHETGHTLGFPHEHMRHELVSLLDPQKTIAYFAKTQGWSELEVRQQVLTPLEESSLLGTVHDDAQSIMCYQLPGLITKSGQPVIGGDDIDECDYQFAASVYPKALIDERDTFDTRMGSML